MKPTLTQLGDRDPIALTETEARILENELRDFARLRKALNAGAIGQRYPDAALAAAREALLANDWTQLEYQLGRRLVADLVAYGVDGCSLLTGNAFGPTFELVRGYYSLRRKAREYFDRIGPGELYADFPCRPARDPVRSTPTPEETQ